MSNIGKYLTQSKLNSVKVHDFYIIVIITEFNSIVLIYSSWRPCLKRDFFVFYKKERYTYYRLL